MGSTARGIFLLLRRLNKLLSLSNNILSSDIPPKIGNNSSLICFGVNNTKLTRFISQEPNITGTKFINQTPLVRIFFGYKIGVKDKTKT